MFDELFTQKMNEHAPMSRALFLKSAFALTPGEFHQVTPDEILVQEFGRTTYVRLHNQGIVPISVIPAGILLGQL